MSAFDVTDKPADQLPLVVDQTFDYVIKRQKRKTIAVHVLPDGTVEVRAPKWLPKYELVDFVEQRADWIVNQRQQVLAKSATKPRFQHGQYHPFLGETFPLWIERAGRSSAQFKDGVLLIKVREPSDSQQIEQALQQWYRKQAEAIFEERMFACFESFPDWFQDKFRIPEITIRKMRRRWGSCSSKGEVTLNLWLMKMPLDCIDYVIVHELCHLHAFHHGKEFYRLLASILPDWRVREALIEQLS
ncbi:M48 family metallopeptidase [Oceanicoccus sp. KOV_DT_Chl]|uniref:M48 family metallopeptidase n=1 Tax=Oceanicoccus sp. KOV_DT_Chl TaxID=1904639 RepID=UPI000C7A368A|nr:SprT family zinc-dependent metalloprotease [Oceanicoccus sp. KOV_DT_Chl]